MRSRSSSLNDSSKEGKRARGSTTGSARAGPSSECSHECRCRGCARSARSASPPRPIRPCGNSITSSAGTCRGPKRELSMARCRWHGMTQCRNSSRELLHDRWRPRATLLEGGLLVGVLDRHLRHVRRPASLTSCLARWWQVVTRLIGEVELAVVAPASACMPVSDSRLVSRLVRSVLPSAATAAGVPCAGARRSCAACPAACRRRLPAPAQQRGDAEVDGDIEVRRGRWRA